MKEKNQEAATGVVYRRSPMWRIALAQMNGASSTCFYILMGYASYCANAGYGILTAVVGIILTATRIFDAITDPLIALILDKMNTRFGKLRIMIGIGWIIEAFSVKLMFDWASGKGHGLGMFILVYLVYVVGYTMQNVTGQIISPTLTNDPKQRPVVGVWSTVFSYLVPTVYTLVINLVLLPKYWLKPATRAWQCPLSRWFWYLSVCRVSISRKISAALLLKNKKYPSKI